MDEKLLTFIDCFKDDKRLELTIISKFIYHKNLHEDKNNNEILNIIANDFIKESMLSIKNKYTHMGYSGIYIDEKGEFCIKERDRTLLGSIYDNNINNKLIDFFKKALIDSDLIESEESIQKRKIQIEALKKLCENFYIKNKNQSIKSLLENFKQTSEYIDFNNKNPDALITDTNIITFFIEIKNSNSNKISKQI